MKLIASIPAVALLLAGLPAIAQDTPICYMQTQAGQIVNLEDLCRGRNRQQPVASFAVDEQEFIGNLNQFLQDAYGAQSASSVAPQAAVSKAKEICNALDLGTFMDYRRIQSQRIAEYRDPTMRRIANSQARAIQTLAPRYFCPAFDN